MSFKKFWKLSLYEWSVWVQRILNKQEKRKQDRDLLIELERNHLAFLGNRTGGKEGGGPFIPTDFYPLSYDQVTEEVKMTGEVMWQLMNDRFKNIPLRKRKNG